MKCFFAVIFIFTTLYSCTQEKTFVIESSKFLSPRSDRPFKSKVKAVVEYKDKIDTAYYSNEITKASFKDEYTFSEQGLLLNWTSEYNNKIDLIFSSNNNGCNETNFKLDRRSKEECSNWVQDDTFHILTIETNIDGNKKGTTKRKYNSKYLIISEDYISANGEKISSIYDYKNGFLDQKRAGESLTKYSYAANTDTVRYFYKNLLTSTTIKFYNQNGDLQKKIVQKDGLVISETNFKYEYDNRMNWTLKKENEKGELNREVSNTKRIITYY